MVSKEDGKLVRWMAATVHTTVRGGNGGAHHMHGLTNSLCLCATACHGHRPYKTRSEPKRRAAPRASRPTVRHRERPELPRLVYTHQTNLAIRI